MELDKLQKGFFGYKKASVYEYLVSLEEEFSVKLMEKDQQMKKNEEQFLSRIGQMEEELKELRKKYDSQYKEQSMIADTLVEAKRFAEQMKKESTVKEEEARAQFEEQLQEKYQELKQYQGQITQIRNVLYKVLQEMDEQMQKMEQEIVATKEECPGRNMTLFERKMDVNK